MTAAVERTRRPMGQWPDSGAWDYGQRDELGPASPAFQIDQPFLVEESGQLPLGSP